MPPSQCSTVAGIDTSVLIKAEVPPSTSLSLSSSPRGGVRRSRRRAQPALVTNAIGQDIWSIPEANHNSPASRRLPSARPTPDHRLHQPRVCCSLLLTCSRRDFARRGCPTWSNILVTLRRRTRITVSCPRCGVDAHFLILFISRRPPRCRRAEANSPTLELTSGTDRPWFDLMITPCLTALGT